MNPICEELHTRTYSDLQIQDWINLSNELEEDLINTKAKLNDLIDDLESMKRSYSDDNNVRSRIEKILESIQ